MATSNSAHNFFTGIFSQMHGKGGAEQPLQLPQGQPQTPDDALRQEAMKRGAIVGSEGGQASIINPTANNLEYYNGVNPQFDAYMRSQAFNRGGGNFGGAADSGMGGGGMMMGGK